MNIENDIANWDGKSSTDIERIYQRYSDKSFFISTLIDLLKQQELQKGASWLLKKHLESGSTLETNDIALIYKLLPKLIHWETKLHILQSMPYMPVGKAQKKKVEAFLRDCLTDDNKFVRAWIYNGFYELSCQYSEYKEETKQFLEMAMKDEAASVKARIRNIMKRGF